MGGMILLVLALMSAAGFYLAPPRVPQTTLCTSNTICSGVVPSQGHSAVSPAPDTDPPVLCGMVVTSPFWGSLGGLVSGVRCGSGGHAAMAFGHRFLWALHRAEEERECLDPTQSLITTFFPVVSQGSHTPEDQASILVRQASHPAVALFRSFLVDFVSLSSVPPGWSSLAAAHPFIGMTGWQPFVPTAQPPSTHTGSMAGQ